MNIKTRILEGVNLYSNDEIVYLVVEDGIDEINNILRIYEEIERNLNLNSKVKVVESNNILEIFIASSDVQICNFVIESLIKGSTTDYITEEVMRIRDEDWSQSLKQRCLKEDIPYIKVYKNEVQIGYGINSIRINKNDYINIYNENDCEIIEKVVKNNKGIIPIVSVSGTNGKTTTVRLIHNILLSLGYKSGLSSTGGIYRGKNVIKHGDTTGFYSAREVLKDTSVEVAVLETARGGILKKGLGYKKAKVAIITSVTEDHIGMEKIKSVNDLADIKSVITKEVAEDGIIVIKAIPILIDKFKEKNNIVLFDDNKSELICRHIKDGGKAFYLENDYIVQNNNGIEKKLVCIKDIPFTFNGVSKSNIRNIIASMIATLYISNDTEGVIRCVKSLKCDIYTNLGRQNIIEFNVFKMIIDYGHNSESFNEVFSIARSLSHKKVIGVITAAGDRKDVYIEELGSIAAKFCDYIIIKEQPDLRGRKISETAALLKKGALNQGFNQSNIEVILSEEEAVMKALNMAGNGDIIVSFSQFLYLTIPVINEFRKDKGITAIGEGLDLSH